MQKTDRKSIEGQVLVKDKNVEGRRALARCLSGDYQLRESGRWPYRLMTADNTVLVCDSGNNRALLWRLSDEVTR